MTNKVNWIKVLEDNEEKIIDALKQAYKQAIGGNSWEECVDIDPNGKICVYTIGNNSTSMDVWKGEVIEIARFGWWEPDVDGEDVVQFLKGEDKLQDFAQWLVNEEYIDPDELNNESSISKEAWLLEKWNQKLWDQYMEEFKDWLMDEFYPGYYFNEAIEGQKLKEEMKEW